MIDLVAVAVVAVIVVFGLRWLAWVTSRKTTTSSYTTSIEFLLHEIKVLAADVRDLKGRTDVKSL